MSITCPEDWAVYCPSFRMGVQLKVDEYPGYLFARPASLKDVINRYEAKSIAEELAAIEG